MIPQSEIITDRSSRAMETEATEMKIFTSFDTMQQLSKAIDKGRISSKRPQNKSQVSYSGQKISFCSSHR
jgi:hypothetical protein